MALSYIQYPADGVTDTFNIPFPFISKSHIQVKVNGVLDAAVTFPTASTVKTSTMPANGAIVDVRRVTPNTNRLVDFADGSLLGEGDLDQSALQVFYIAQEVSDDLSNRLAVSSTNTWDALNKRIVNVANGIHPNDAVNVSQTVGIATQAASSALNAETSSNHAANSASLAQDWAVKTSGQVDGVSFSAKEYAQGNQSGTGGSAKNWASKTTGTVEGGEFSAKEYAQGSQNGSGGSAKDWASKAEDIPVISGQYSARHWAQKAANSAAAINIPTMIGNGNKYLRSRSDETGFEYLTKANVKSDLREIGEISDYSGSVAPLGWLLCYGQAVSRSTYAWLFSMIGTTYGAGDGSTTFNLPDLRGRFALGKEDMGGSSANRVTSASTNGSNATILGGVGGTETHTLTISQMPNHDHNLLRFNAFGSGSGSGYTVRNDGTAAGYITSTGGGAAHSNTPPWMSLNKIIFTGV